MTTQDLLKTNWKYLEAMREGQVVEWQSCDGEWQEMPSLCHLGNCIDVSRPLRIKPKPIECWAAVDKENVIMFSDSFKVVVTNYIGRMANQSFRLVHLVEQPEEGEVGK